MERKPIFLLGIGVQKAGTTWMHQHLAQHPDTAFHHNFTKEFNLAQFHFRRQPRLFSEPLRWWKMQRCLGDLRLHRAIRMRATFFRPLLNRPRREVMERFMTSGAIHRMILRWSRPTREHPRGLVVGDISPIYAQFYLDDLPRVLQALEQEFEVRAMLMWRDPLDRLDSAMKHVTREKQPKGIRILNQFCQDGKMDSWSSHSNYVHAAEVLDRFFANSFELVYEELFGPNGQTHIDAFHDWLGIRRVPGNFDLRVHGAGSGSKALTPEQRTAARAFLQPHYDVVVERLGRERLASIWNI